MHDTSIAPALAAAAPPASERGRAERLNRQVSTYLLYRSFSTDERNRPRPHVVARGDAPPPG